MDIVIGWVEGHTAPKRFRLSINGTPPDMTGRSVTLILRKKDGTLVSSPGSVSIILPQTGDNVGLVEYTPQSASTLVAADAPYTAHFKDTSGGLDRFFPDEGDADPMRWTVVRAGG